VHLTNDGRLTISGDRRPPTLLANTDPALAVYPVKELKYGRFERTINVPAGLQVCPSIWFVTVSNTPVLDALTRVMQVKDINACLTDGMLSISWPRAIPLPVLPQAPTHVLSMAL
jgi:HSP20 family protein